MANNFSRRRMIETAGLAAFAPARLRLRTIRGRRRSGQVRRRSALARRRMQVKRKCAATSRSVSITCSWADLGPLGRRQACALIMDRYKSAGITVINMMIGGFNDVIWGKSNADAQIEDVIKSIGAAGKVAWRSLSTTFTRIALWKATKKRSDAAAQG